MPTPQPRPTLRKAGDAGHDPALPQPASVHDSAAKRPAATSRPAATVVRRSRTEARCPVYVRLLQRDVDALDEFCAARGASKQEIVEEALRRYLTSNTT